MRNAIEVLEDWSHTHYLGNHTSLSTIREVLVGTEAVSQSELDDDEQLSFIRDFAVQRIREKKVEAARDAVKTLTDLINRGSHEEVIEGMQGHHAYLVNELIWDLLKATKQRCKVGGFWDGRIAPNLAAFMDEWVF